MLIKSGEAWVSHIEVVLQLGLQMRAPDSRHYTLIPEP